MNICIFSVLCLSVFALAAGESCHNGETKKVECNTCRCNNGVFACTRRFCPPQREKRETACVSGQTKKLDCNTCTCKNGAWACTLKACLKRRRRDVQKKTVACKEGEQYSPDNGCNTCTCGKNGVYACTLKACFNRRLRETTCKDGERYSPDNGCNFCTCSSNNFACTRRACVERPRPPRDAFSCTPGQTFKKDCNTCTCTKDGKNAVCTLKACLVPPSLNKQDSTTA